MQDKKFDIFYIIFSPYVLEILRELENGPKRFRDLKKLVKSEQTLSTKLDKLMKNKVIEFAPVLTGEGYANGYKLSSKGTSVLAKLDGLVKK